MKILPPGNILQNLYLKERLRENKWKTFLEIGSGNGYLSNVMLTSGLSGTGCDLNQDACKNNSEHNARYIEKGRYKVLNKDFTTLSTDEKYDLIIAAMVIEHIPDEELKGFISKCKSVLSPSGSVVFFVPSSMKYWGIEDEIAGHIKRYEFVDFENFNSQHQLKVNHIAGLNYPVSNWLFRISNFLIKKAESSKLELSQKERTVYTGNRNVSYKTNFPGIFGLVLNEWVMYPFHLLQKAFKNNKNSMVIYCELKPLI